MDLGWTPLAHFAHPFEGLPIGFDIHDSARAFIAFYPVSVRMLELAAIFHGTNSMPISGLAIFGHD